MGGCIMNMYDYIKYIIRRKKDEKFQITLLKEDA